MPDVQR